MKKSLLFVFLLFVFYSSFSQAPLVKMWDYRFGGPNDDHLTCFQQTSDGGYIIGGYSPFGIGGNKTKSGQGYLDYWIVKIDAFGYKQWDRTFGGIDEDDLLSLQQTSDGGYILGGISFSGISGDKTQALIGQHDYWIVKTTALGIKQWDKTFGGIDSDSFRALKQTSDGGYIIGGTSRSGVSGDKTQPNHGATDYWIIKTDAFGNKQWDKTYGGTSDNWFYDLQQTVDGGFILGGLSDSGIGGDKTQASKGDFDYWIVKTDSLGNKQWDKTLGGTFHDSFHILQQTNDGGYILGGTSNSDIGGDKTQIVYGSYDFWIVKTDSLGNKQWDRDFGGTSTEELYSIVQTNDSGYLIGGDSYSPISGTKTENNLGQEQTWIVKTDSNGNKQWDKTIFTTGHDDNSRAIQSSDGCYVFANYSKAGIGAYKTEDPWASEDYWIIKFCDSLHSTPFASFISSDTSFCEETGKCIDFFDHSNGNPTSWKWFFPGAMPDTSAQQNPSNICYNTPGTYAVTLIVSNSNGSDSLTVSSMITFVASTAAPVLDFLGDTIYCSHAAAYQWYFNGLPIAGATDSFYVAAGYGVYAVMITDGNGCTRLSDGFPVSVNELIGVGGVRIYPNPAGSQLTIDNGQLTMGSTVVLEIYNVFGKKVLQSEITKPKSEIDISSLRKGIYFVKVNGSAGAIRLVKID